MTIKKFVALLSACCSILIYSITAIQVSAITSTPRFIDNDTNVSGYSNSRYGFSEYMSSSSLYYSDARIQNSNNSSYSYHYHFPTVSTTKDNISVEIKAYLNHSRFTDPRAEYYASVNIDDVYYKIGTINQNSANAGWNYVNTRSFSKNYKIQGAFVVNEAYVCPSGSSGYETGADAVYVTPSY